MHLETKKVTDDHEDKKGAENDSKQEEENEDEAYEGGDEEKWKDEKEADEEEEEEEEEDGDDDKYDENADEDEEDDDKEKEDQKEEKEKEKEEEKIQIVDEVPIEKYMVTKAPINKEYCAKKLEMLRYKLGMLSQRIANVKLGNFTDKKNKACTRYTHEARVKSRHNVTNIWSELNIVNKDDIAFVTQMTVHRMFVLALVAEHWTGPIDVAMQAKPEELELIPKAFKNYTSLLNRKNIQLHVVIEEGVSTK